MKLLLRAPFGWLWSILEDQDGQYVYKPSHRWILIEVSSMFGFLAGLSFYLMPDSEPGYIFSVIVFGGISFMGFVVALLGEDSAVARLWGSR